MLPYPFQDSLCLSVPSIRQDQRELVATISEDYVRSPQGGLYRSCDSFQHLITSTMPLLVMCDRRDVDAYHETSHGDLGLPTLFLYDAYEGGIGLAEIAYQGAEELMQLAYETVAGCGCVAGCPSCIQLASCRLRNESLDKASAQAILAALTGRDMSNAGVGMSPMVAQRRVSLPSSSNLALSRKRALQDLHERTFRQGLRGRQSGEPSEEKSTVHCVWHEGDWVEHATHGRGVVLSSRIQNGREYVSVRFLSRGRVREIDPSRTPLNKPG